MNESNSSSNYMELAADIVSAFVSNNSVPANELPALIETVHASIGKIVSGARAEPAAEARAPAVPIKKSVTDDFIICLEDGKKFKSLKRHLNTAYGMSPDEYRTKWGLRPDYPMVAPAYAAARSALATQMGLGRKQGSGASPAAPTAAAPKKGRGRPKGSVTAA